MLGIGLGEGSGSGRRERRARGFAQVIGRGWGCLYLRRRTAQVGRSAAEGEGMSAPAPLPDSSAPDRAAMAAIDAVVRRIEAAAERFAASGAHEDAAACAQVGSTVAWMNHPGRFASARFEQALHETRPRSHLCPYERRAANGDPQRVLHVLSEGYETGGHTRLAWRWMLQDAGRTHALAFTPSSSGASLASRGRGAAGRRTSGRAGTDGDAGGAGRAHPRARRGLRSRAPPCIRTIPCRASRSPDSASVRRSCS